MPKITDYTEKTSIVGDDLVLIADSAASDDTKKVKLERIFSGTISGAFVIKTAETIAAGDVVSIDANVVLKGLASPLLGIAQGAGTAGETITVAVSGISSVHAGLTPGSLYYSDAAGDLSTGVSDMPIGYALSATEIFMYGFTFADMFSSATAETTVAAGDLVLIWDTSESAVRKMTQANFTA